MQPQLSELPWLRFAYFVIGSTEDKVIDMVKHVFRADQSQLLRKLSIDRQVLHQVIEVKKRYSAVLLVELAQPQDAAPEL